MALARTAALRASNRRLHKKQRALFHGQSDFLTSPVSEHTDKKDRWCWLWQEFFTDPSQWWDNRLAKKNPRSPDFRHKVTLEPLWIDSWLNPSWVKEKIVTVAFDQMQSSSRLTSRVPASFGNYDMVQQLSEQGRLKEAISLSEVMVHESRVAPKGAFVCLLRGCTRRKALAEGKLVHSLIVRSKCNTDIFLSNLLVNMYSNCGSMVDALKVFNAMPQRNIFSWTAMISAHANSGQYKEALTLFQQMQETGAEPDKVTCLIVLKACASIGFLEQGQQLHRFIRKRGFDSDVIIQTSLIDMYEKCGCLKDAWEVFSNMPQRDVVSWNAMIAGYAQKGLGKKALDLYEQMKQEGMEPDNTTVLLLVKSCASIPDLKRGKELHSLILAKGWESERIIQTSLVDMYAKCGCIEAAREVFNHMTQRDVVAWSAMIAGYAQKGLGKEALHLYEQMKHEGAEPNSITLVLLLQACASISALEQGKQLHSLIREKGFDSELTIQSTLIDMYAKCGCLKDACELFNNMPLRNVVSWSAMIAGYAQEGHGKEALDLFKQMKHEDLQANEVTYTCVLSACSHSGLLDEGRHVFESLLRDNGVTPTLEHYSCMVDLLSRAGFLADAEDFILKMPIRPHEAVWMSLLGAARKYANVEIGRRAFEHILELKPEGNAAPYLLLMDIYLAAGRMDEVAQLSAEMKHKGLEKVLEYSWNEGDNQVPSIVCDKSHAHNNKRDRLVC